MGVGDGGVIDNNSEKSYEFHRVPPDPGAKRQAILAGRRLRSSSFLSLRRHSKGAE